MPVERAAIWSMLGGYLLLPSALEINGPGLPPLDKMGITAIGTVLLCWMKGTAIPRPKRSILMDASALAFVVSPILTSLDNSYELANAAKSIPGFYPLDGLKFAGRNLLTLIPLYIGSRFLSTDNARIQLLRAIPAVMLFYSLPMLVELKISPQIHRLVYGYFPHPSFAQQARDGGWRPVVFFSHGLALALFTALALVAAIVLYQMRSRVIRFSAAAVAAYFSALLVLCKSLGPIMYAVVFGPLIVLTRPRTWVKVGCVASLIICAYPLLRNHGLAPTQIVGNFAQLVSADRSISFQVRVDNEEQLLAHANQKPLLGWGGWGRNLIFDKSTGQDISTIDGGWIAQFGVSGWFGYLSLFGLLAVVQFRALRSMDKENTPANIARGGLSLLLTIYIVDSIPNAMQIPLVFLLAGAIASSPSVRRKFAVARPRANTEIRPEPAPA